MERHEVRVVGQKSAEALLAELRELGRDLDEVPEGFKSTEYWGESWGINRAYAGALIKKGIEAGLWEARRFRIVNGEGRPYPVPHYRPKQ